MDNPDDDDDDDDDDGTSISLSSLLCDEDPNFLHSDDNENIGIHSLNPCLIREDEEEHIQSLVRREMEFMSSNECSTAGRVRLNNTRLDAIDWIFKTREEHGFKFHTAYWSVTYFDRFLSKRTVNEDSPLDTRLLWVACLSLAAKMEEHKPPLLSQYITGEEERFIENQSIGKMELAVTCTLEWKMRTVTPFDYLHYFVCMFCAESPPESIVSEAEEHVVAIVKDVNLINQRPSIIALAATLMAAFGAGLTRETMNLQISIVSSWGNQDGEHLFSCYNLMQEKEKEKEREKLHTPSSSLTDQWSKTSVLDNSSVTSSTARRGLSFDDKENCPEQNPHEP